MLPSYLWMNLCCCRHGNVKYVATGGKKHERAQAAGEGGTGAVFTPALGLFQFITHNSAKQNWVKAPSTPLIVLWLSSGTDRVAWWRQQLSYGTLLPSKTGWMHLIWFLEMSCGPFIDWLSSWDLSRKCWLDQSHARHYFNKCRVLHSRVMSETE